MAKLFENIGKNQFRLPEKNTSQDVLSFKQQIIKTLEESKVDIMGMLGSHIHVETAKPFIDKKFNKLINDIARIIVNL